MLDRFGRSELQALVASEGGPHLSIYLPTHLAAADTQQDVLRLKNFIQDAESQLTEGWMRSTEAREFLSPLEKLIHDEGFWRQRQNGLAIFRAQNEFLLYRLGVSFDERLSISRDYLIRPIVPVLHRQSHGFVLALSEHKVALYEITDESIQAVAVPGLPINLDKTLNLTSTDRGQQVHSGASAKLGKRAEVYHGQGGMPDSHKEDLRHFLRAVDAAIVAHLGDSKVPLVLACVDATVPIYREINSYHGLRAEYLAGNADYFSPQELHAKTIPILLAEQIRSREALMNKINEHLETAIASAHAGNVVRAAFQGRIHTLFFDEAATVDGQFDPTLQAAVVYSAKESNELARFNTDLIELTVEQTLRHKGDVYSVSQSDMPAQAPMAALFRY